MYPGVHLTVNFILYSIAHSSLSSPSILITLYSSGQVYSSAVLSLFRKLKVYVILTFSYEWKTLLTQILSFDLFMSNGKVSYFIRKYNALISNSMGISPINVMAYVVRCLSCISYWPKQSQCGRCQMYSKVMINSDHSDIFSLWSLLVKCSSADFLKIFNWPHSLDVSGMPVMSLGVHQVRVLQIWLLTMNGFTQSHRDFYQWNYFLKYL